MFPSVKRSLRVEALEDRTTPATIYALQTAGQELIRFDTNTPGTTTTVPVTGLAVGGTTERIVAIDFRPETGQLYALAVNETASGDDEGRLYTIALNNSGATPTATATQVGSGTISTALDDAATAYDIDFNPVADALRVVTNTGQNLRVDPTNGAVTVETPLVFAAGDPDLTGTPNIVAAAYSNNTADATATTLYAVDATLDRLLTITPPASGTLTDVGPLGVNVTAETGFDIGADGIAYLGVTTTNPDVGVSQGQLYTVNLATGQATLVNNVGPLSGFTTFIRDIAVAPEPTVTIEQASGQADPATGGPVTFTVTFSEAVTGFDASDVTVTLTPTGGGTPVTVPAGGITVTGTGTTYTVAVNNIPQSGTLTATVNAGAATGTATGATSLASTSTDNQVTVNLATAPTVTINQASGQADPATGGPVTFTVTFSEAVTGFDASDVQLTGAGAQGATVTVAPVAGSTTAYTVTVNNVTQSGPITATVNAGAATGTASGLASVASTSTDNTVTVNLNADTTRPTATITRAAGQGSPTNQTPIQFTVTFSEPVTGFDASDVQLSGAGATGLTASNVVVTGSGTTYTVTVSGMTQAGPVRINVPEGAATDAAGNTSLAATAENNNNQVVFNFGVGLGTGVGDRFFAVGAGAGEEGRVRVFDAAAKEVFSFTPFGSEFTGGVRVATGDFNNDGVVDVAVGAGPGVSNIVQVYDGKTRAVIHTINPFESSFAGGVYLAAGDVTGDGIPELVITPDLTGGPRVRIFDLSGGKQSQVADFFGIEDPNFRGGARAAVGDVNGDGIGDVLVAAGFGGGPRVAVFDGSKIQTQLAQNELPPKLFGDFFVFEQTLRNGVFVTAGDLNADGKADVIVGGGPGGGPRVFALSGADLNTSAGKTLTQLANFFAGDDDNRQGVRLTAKNLDGDNRADIVTGAGDDEGEDVSGYLGANIPVNGVPQLAFDIDAIEDDPAGGVYVG